MKVYAELNKAVRAGAKITHEKLKSENEAGAIMALCVALGALIIMVAAIVNTYFVKGIS